ncbi:peptidase S8/S53 domain-containing protein [Lactarius hatsudake]|nr:peptidase S8/S53 domain-containing protein [Lactarius hatsudake]
MWKHTEDGDALVRTTQYSLPPHLDEHIELIQPTTVFNRAKAQRTTYHIIDLNPVASSQSLSAKVTVPGSGVTVDASCNMTITVSCLKQLYNAANYFYADQVPAAVNTSFDVVLINGGLNNQTLAEAGSDRFGRAVRPWHLIPNSWAPYIKDALTPNAMNEPYGGWLDFVLAQHKIPQVISTSYGDDEKSVPMDCAHRDGGVGDGDPDPATQTCFMTNGKNQSKFLPYFPASCPDVTAVGATTQIPEVAAHYSGGALCPHPSDWCTSVPAPVLAEGRSHQVLRTATGWHLRGALQCLRTRIAPQLRDKAFPDISAQGSSFRIFYRGRPARISGTSASAPSLAAFVTLLNDARIAVGKPSLGFLNPLIYALNGVGSNDITAGNAPGCGTLGSNVSASSLFWVSCDEWMGSPDGFRDT